MELDRDPKRPYLSAIPLRPRKNVLIYSAVLRNNKLDSVARYEPYAAALKKWASMAERHYVWDYDANYRNFYIPYPNYFAMGESIRFFKEIGVDGVMVQSSYGKPADMQPMLRPGSMRR